MIGFMLAAALVATPARCPLSAGDERLAQLPLDVGGGRVLQAISAKHPGDGPLGIAAVKLSIYAPKCEVVFQQTFDLSTDIRLVTTKLGDTSVLVVTVLSPGGSGCGLQHVILDYTDGGNPFVINPMDLMHDNMGAVFVGDLGKSRGPGLAYWEALWESGSHYDPHRFRLITYRWRDHRFVGPEVSTTRPMSPDPARVAKRLGIPFAETMSAPC